MTPELVRFAIAGALNTGSTYLLYLGLLPLVHYQAAYGVAYLAGIALSYLLNSLFVFRTPLSVAGLLRFPLVYVAQYLFGGSLLYLLVERAGVGRELAMAAVVVLSVPLIFVLSRMLLVGQR